MANDVFFTTNPSEFPKLEGLYVSERNPPGFIAGADLSVVGMGGLTVRGPETPQAILSPARMVEVYGGRDHGNGGALVNEVWAARLSKPFGSTVIRRVVAADAVAASLTMEVGVDGTGAEVLQITASSKGAWAAAGLLAVSVVDASDGDATHFDLLLRYQGEITRLRNLNINGAADDNLAEVVGDDIARLVDLTKVADGRPENTATVTEAAFVAARDADDYIPLASPGAAYTGATGSDGTPVSGDYIAALDDLAYYEGISIVLMAGASVDQNALNGQISVHAAAVADRTFPTWSGTHGQVSTTEITNADTDFPTRNDRPFWCFNSFYVRDPETNLEIQRGPHELMASILSQLDVDIHPGSREAAPVAAGITRLTNEALTRAELVALKAAGICTLEKLPGMFLFRSGVTMSLEEGKEEITRRRMADFLQLSAADKLRDFVKAKNTRENRALVAGLLIGFSQSLRDSERVVEEFAVEQASVNTSANRAKGIEKILWRVKTIGHWLSLVLETEIGTGVDISEAGQ